MPDRPVRVPAVPAVLPRHLQPILDELLRGATDATASRRLNMSPRTYSRRVAELLDWLGATTRFQGGAEVALRGWLRDERIPPEWTVPAPRRLLR